MCVNIPARLHRRPDIQYVHTYTHSRYHKYGFAESGIFFNIYFFMRNSLQSNSTVKHIFIKGLS